MSVFKAIIYGGPLDGEIRSQPIAPRDGDEFEFETPKYRYLYRFIWSGSKWRFVGSQRLVGRQPSVWSTESRERKEKRS